MLLKGIYMYMYVYMYIYYIHRVGVVLIRAYHCLRSDDKRTHIIINSLQMVLQGMVPSETTPHF